MKKKMKLSCKGKFKKSENCADLCGLIIFALFLITSLCPNYLLAAPVDDFVITVKTDNSGTSADNEFAIPTYSSETYDYSVDLDNDGTPEYAGITGNTTCVFATNGTYTIRIQGVFPRIYFSNGEDKHKIISIDQWGTGIWSSMEEAFYGCSNLTGQASDSPNLSNVTNMIGMFAGATSFNQNINSWNISNVVNMRAMFFEATSFNQPLNGWNTENVVSMAWMFKNATSFNQPIGNWNTGKVNNMEAMFEKATSFNQDISTWNTANVTTMVDMFREATSFNQSLNGWITTKLEIVYNMFLGASSFNQAIDNWDMSKVTNMYKMFRLATSFNQDISGWNTISVVTMESMFAGATSFDQNLSNWNVSNLTQASHMFDNAPLSVSNYDALLVGWNTQGLSQYCSFGAGTNQYFSNEAQTARANMISTYNWTIIDGGLYIPPTLTVTPTITITSTNSPTFTKTATITKTPTISPTSTITPTNTNTSTVTASPEKVSTFGQQVLAYPNPSRDKVNFAFKDSNIDNVVINIYSLAGDRIARIEETNPGQTITWETVGIAPGIYLAQIVIIKDGVENRLNTKKIAIIH